MRLLKFDVSCGRRAPAEQWESTRLSVWRLDRSRRVKTLMHFFADDCIFCFLYWSRLLADFAGEMNADITCIFNCMRNGHGFSFLQGKTDLDSYVHADQHREFSAGLSLLLGLVSLACRAQRSLRLIRWSEFCSKRCVQMLRPEHMCEVAGVFVL